MMNTIAHESAHVALDIYQHMHQDVLNSSSEPFCYLVGYAAECMCKTLAKK